MLYSSVQSTWPSARKVLTVVRAPAVNKTRRSHFAHWTTALLPLFAWVFMLKDNLINISGVIAL